MQFKQPKKPEKTILKSGTCKCIEAPMARHNLEGFVLDEVYKCEIIRYGKTHWVRVFPTDLTTDESYYETCSLPTFTKYFKMEEINDYR